MRNIILSLFLILALSTATHAAMYGSTPEKQIVNVSPTGQITTLTGSGVLTIVAPSAIFFELTATTPNTTTSPPAGGTYPTYVNTEQRYFKGDRIGLISASGTVNAILLFQEP